jgi:uncharacterized damage-inducible protein DinB
MAPSPLSRGDSQAYIEALLAYLGDRDPLDVFAETEAALREATAGLDDAALRTREAPDKWSVMDVVKHLADVEFVLGFRYRRAVGEPGSTVPSIDQDAWVRNLDYASADLEATLDMFATLRAVNLDFLHGLTDTQWEGYIMHSDRGREPMPDMVRLYAAHDVYHVAQIERIKGVTR